MANILYLAYGGAEVTVFDSQVLVPLKLLKTQGADIHLTLFQNWKEYLFNRTRLEQKAFKAYAAMGRQPMIFPRIPRNLFGINTRRLRHTLEFLAELHPGTMIVHARGMQSAALAIKARGDNPRVKIILDHRGLEAEEYLYIVKKEKRREPNASDQIWFHRLQEMEKEAVEGADHIFCVSNALKNNLASKYGKAEKITVIPCGVDMKLFQYDSKMRREMRASLGLEKRLVLAYAGTLRAWQEASILPRVLSAAKRAVPESFLLVLTPNEKAAHQALAGASQTDYRVIHAPHQDMPKYLQASDIGVLTRESHIVNQVASPTKAPEYLATGNLILTTPHPEDLSTIVQKEGVGAVSASVEDSVSIEASIRVLHEKISKEGETARLKARQAAEKYYSWTRHLPKITEAYRRLG